VVKPGDIVKVKVLDFEVARKRISLTLRLDDEVGAKKDAPGMRRDDTRNTARMTSSAPRQQESSGGGALAEAMRRAAEKNGGKRV
jgi:protein Tex